MSTKVKQQSSESIIRDKQHDSKSDQWLEIFAIFVHDLESPLASTKYLLGLLENGKYDPDRPTHQRLVRSTRIAIDRAETILYDVMAVARAGKVGIPVSLTSLVPDTIVREAIDLAFGSIEEHGLKITFTNNAGTIPVIADPKLLKRTLDNLIYNAIRHTPAGGTIALYTEPGERSVFIHVKDSGPGLGDIDPVELFEKYGQLKARAEGKHRGVGLGLYFCKLAATGMGGTILADDHPKGGAVFTIKLQKS